MMNQEELLIAEMIILSCNLIFDLCIFQPKADQPLAETFDLLLN